MNQIAFDLRVGPLDEADVAVSEVKGEELLSGPFTFEVDFIPVAGEAIDLGPLVRAEARLCMRRPSGETRWVHGVCVKAEDTGRHTGKASYRVTLKPKLALLAEKDDSRVFENKSAVEIVKEVLDEHGIAHACGGGFETRPYPKREICVQHRESDLHFVSRLLEEEGIAYWFEQRENEHVMVLGDNPNAYPLMPGGELLPYRQEIGDVAGDEHVFELRVTRQVGPERAMLRDYDFERPGLDVTGETPVKASSKPAPTHAELYDYPSGNASQPETKRLAQIRLEELQVASETWHGRGTCTRLNPGSIFEVIGHPNASFDRRLLTVCVAHHGRQQTSVEEVVGSGLKPALHTYKNTFIAIDEKKAYRPECRTKPPVIASHQTATVVGVASEEIDLDKYGRVKVQFHWDRKGKPSSAWVRTAQAWAGPGSGALFVPRVGQEVVVKFLEGNPDRPIVTGAVYNGQNRPPITLPHDKTRSTVKSDSSPYTGGFNELRLEDAKGMEQVTIHAQKNEEIVVRDDKEQKVHGEEKLEVRGNRTRSVRGNQDLVVALDDVSLVKANQTLTVQEDRGTVVYGSERETVIGDQQVTVRGMRDLEVLAASQEQIGGASELTIGTGYDVNVAGAYNEQVGGAKTVRVEGSRSEEVRLPRKDGGEESDSEEPLLVREEAVEGDSEAEVGRGFVSDVTGQVVSYVTENQTEEVAAETEITVSELANLVSKKCKLVADELTLSVAGKLVLSMKKSGLIQFYGKSITIDGKKVVLRGSQIMTVSPGSAAKNVETKKLEELRVAKAIAEFTLVDQDGSPVVNERFTIEFPDGTVKKGATDGDGRAKVPAARKGTYKLTFPEDPNAKEPWPPVPSWKGKPKANTPGATLVKRGEPRTLATDKNHLLELPEKRGVVTVSFLFDARTGEGYPKYVLESEDGAYHQERTPKDDLVKGDEYLQFQFDRLLGGKRYKLTCWHDASNYQLQFWDVPYAELIDQHRKLTSGLVKDARFLLKNKTFEHPWKTKGTV